MMDTPTLDRLETCDVYEDAMDEAIDLLFTAGVREGWTSHPAILDAWTALFCARHPDWLPEGEATHE